MPLRRDPLLALAAAVLLISGAVGLAGAASWIGRPFPGFLVLANRVVASAGLPHWPAVQGGEIYQHAVVAVDGRPVASVDALLTYVGELPLDTPVRYRLRYGGRETERVVRTRRFQASDFAWLFGPYLLTGIAHGGVALGIRYLRGRKQGWAAAGRDRVGNAASGMLWLIGVFALSAMDLYGPYRLFRLHVLCETFLFASVLHMALFFPHPARMLDRRPWLPGAIYGAAGALALVAQVGLYHPPTYVVTHLLATSALGAALLVLTVSQVGRFIRPPSFEARQRVKVFMFAAAAAHAVPIALSLAGGFTGGQENWNYIALAGPLFPFAIGYATLRHDLLEIDEVVRRSLSYAIVTLIVTLTYVGSVAASGSFFGGRAPPGVVPIGLAVACVVALAARDRIQSGIDRVFFRSAYDFRRVVETTSARLASVAELDVIGDEIERAVGQTLHPEWLALFAPRGPDGPLVPLRRRGEAAPAEADRLAARMAGSTAPVDLGDATLGVAFRSKGELLGLLLLGRRSSGMYYGGDDRRLLQTLANQCAVAIENALALEQLRDLNRSLEAKVEERTAKLARALHELRDTQAQLVHREKMASIGQFVAGIAHEMNNPLSFIEGNLHFLRRYTASLTAALGSYREALAAEPRLLDRVKREQGGEVDRVVEDLRSVLDGCTEGVERTTALVRDLRTFSRLDQPERVPMNLHEALDSTLNLLRSRLVGIRVVREYGDIPPVECLTGQLNQVFMNLLANAADAVGEAGTITVRTQVLGGARVAVEVEDDGSGIDPEHLDRIFEPFFSTKEVGHGTGLGLAISYGIVQRHAGTIRVDSRPGEGTRFRVELPVRAPDAEPEGDLPQVDGRSGSISWKL